MSLLLVIHTIHYTKGEQVSFFKIILSIAVMSRIPNTSAHQAHALPSLLTYGYNTDDFMPGKLQMFNLFFDQVCKDCAHFLIIAAIIVFTCSSSKFSSKVFLMISVTFQCSNIFSGSVRKEFSRVPCSGIRSCPLD